MPRLELGALLIAIGLAACASAPPVSQSEHCFLQNEALARELAALVTGLRPDEGSLHVEDQGDHWRVGRYAETWLEDGMIMSRDAGFMFKIDKCSGAMSGYQSWP